MISTIMLLLHLIEAVQKMGQLRQRGGTRVDPNERLPKLALRSREQIGSLVAHYQASLEKSH
jgi:hypothetical protein